MSSECSWAMQERPVAEVQDELTVPAVEEGDQSASKEQSLQASLRGHAEETEPLRPTALRAAFLTLDAIVLRATLP